MLYKERGWYLRAFRDQQKRNYKIGINIKQLKIILAYNTKFHTLRAWENILFFN